MGMPGGTELIVILLIVVLLFGAKKIPELASGLGKGIKNFKGAMKDEEEVASKETKQQIEAEEVKAEPTKTTSETETLKA